MNDVLEQVYETRSAVKEAFLRAESELQMNGAVSEETQCEIANLCRDPEQIVTELANWYLYTESKLEGLRAEYAPAREMMERNEDDLDSRLKFIKSCIARVLPQRVDSQVANQKAYVFYKHTSRIKVLDHEAVPLDCRRQVLIDEPDLFKIEALIRSSDEPVLWARIEENYSPQIKPGGDRAIKNAANRLKRLREGNGSDE